MSFTPSLAKFDRRTQQMNDDSVQRAIRIRNLQNMDTLLAPAWKAKQRATYVSAVPVTTDPDLGQILSDSIQQTFEDPLETRMVLYNRLLKIATPTIANLIADPKFEQSPPVLDDQEARFFLGNFDLFLKSMKEANIKMYDLQQLIQNIKRKSMEFYVGNAPNMSGPNGTPFKRPQPPTPADENDNDNSPQGGNRLSMTGPLVEVNRNAPSNWLGTTPGRDPHREPPQSGGTPSYRERLGEPMTLGNVFEREQSGQIISPQTPTSMRPNPTERQSLLNTHPNEASALTGAAGGGDSTPQNIEMYRGRRRGYAGESWMRGSGTAVRYGRGATQRTSTSRHYLGNYYVDLNKLKENVLCVRYAKTDAQLPQMKVQRVSNGVKENVEDILKGKFDKRIYNLMNDDDKRLVKRFAKSVRMSLDLDDDLDKDFQQEYEVLLGEYASGNNNPELKAKLKQFVVKAIGENLIPRHQAMLLLYQLSL